MPVPVPTRPKSSAHPVIKRPYAEHGHSHSFHGHSTIFSTTSSGPAPAQDPWPMSTAQPWARSRPNRIWEEDISPQDFYSSGLAHADNAQAIKGSFAQVNYPPTSYDDHMDDDPCQGGSPISQRESSSVSSGSSCSPMRTDQYERGAFSPVYEDQSPAGNNVSSPIEPYTPFDDFVDLNYPPLNACSPAYDSEYGTGLDLFQGETQELKEPSLPQEIATPSASFDYKKLAEPISEWLANYVWKACTAEASPSPFRGIKPVFRRHYPQSPPDYLAPAIHSLLLSTLLQPSAIFLSLWYIARLPISFGDIGLSREDVHEARFRAALLGAATGPASEANEASAPFRIMVLGCMLANKWLDDHTFSNKTWHTISSLPILNLNELEAHALRLFEYELNISNVQWSQWMQHILGYHTSLSSSHIQPISRPSSNPISIIRRTIDEIMQAPAACNFDPTQPEPIFVGLDERRRESLEKERQQAMELSEFDMDEGGPLREEYIPKRRVNAVAPIRSDVSRENIQDPGRWPRMSEHGKELPPPAKWSPAGDEPILRDRNRTSGHYMAVRPTHGYPIAPYAQDIRYQAQHHWSAGYVPQQPMSMAYPYDAPHHQGVPVYRQPLPYAVPMSHSRSQSSQYYQEAVESRNRLRSFSHSQPACGDMRMSAAHDFCSPPGLDGPWARVVPNTQYAPLNPHVAPASYHPQWLRC
ncbi:hypothetical protein CYLTODRAFT_406502 [Cylindrobasidium torrendii FP15055 ss-10]|uniref:Cyclin N-terminal domain-containing protein n=1 Tax=Cylindrobasidium torrendii FP15055 ss-10 TaxID=1314674 RepID=A0A0D7BTS0_9AGAR|nr:hypothetical protein CYLTODRAFT_406502 [Cylindrobasidium torrendii FP15055 ss-10]